MKVVETLPLAFARFEQIGGALSFAVYENAEGNDAEALAGIAASIPDLHVDTLKSLGFRRIDKLAFFGDWYDSGADAVLKLGRFSTSDGEELVNPKLMDLDKVHIVSGGSPLPEPGAGGQFAYAFSSPPYALTAEPGEIQGLFREITEFILPPNLDYKILDWSSLRLPEASEFFAAGVEWWGVFLFTIHVPSIKRLTVIAGSSSD